MTRVSIRSFIPWLLLLLCTNLIWRANLTCDGLRILGLFPFNSKSHFIMNERLLRGLAERGHRVDVYGHFPLRDPPANYTDYSLANPNVLPDLMNNLTYDMLLEFESKPGGSFKHVMQTAGGPLCELMGLPSVQKLLHEPPQDPPYDLVFVEVCLSPCYLAWGRHLDLPLVDISTNVLPDWNYEPRGISVTPALLPAILTYYRLPNNFLDRLNNFAVYSALKLLMWYFMSAQDHQVEKFFGPGYPTVWQMYKDPALVFINYHHALHGVRPLTPSVVPISGIHINDGKNDTLPEDLQNWLDECKDGFVYFSFGSMFRIETLPRHMLETFYRAFQNIAPVRVLWRIVEPKNLPANLPKNVLIQKWLQQQQILKHKNVRAFVTHGGLMGTLEAVYYGVPMIGIPLFAEQSSNIDMYVRKNIAVKVDLSRLDTDFENGLAEILKNTSYRENAMKVRNEYRDTAMSPLDTAIYWIEYIARHGKNALRSPVADMPWWQISLLDVYAFVLGVALLALYVTAKALKILVRPFIVKKCDTSHAKEKIK